MSGFERCAVIMSEARDLQYLVGNTRMQILRFAQDDGQRE